VFEKEMYREHEIERITAESCMGEVYTYYRAWRNGVLIAAESTEEEIRNRIDSISVGSSCTETFKQESAGWINNLSKWCREANDNWWRDPKTELSECLEGVRKNLQDGKLPHRRMEEVELADCLIRIFDYAGAFGLDLGGAFVEKMTYNAKRADYKP